MAGSTALGVGHARLEEDRPCRRPEGLRGAHARRRLRADRHQRRDRPGAGRPLRGALAPSPSASPPSRPVPASAAPIAFVATTWCTAGAAHNILTIDPDRTDLTSVSCARGQDIDPAWSPDGRRSPSRRTGPATTDLGDERRRQRRHAADEGHRGRPAPGVVARRDAHRVRIGRSTTKNTTDLWVMNSDGSSPTRLLAMPGNERYPDWAPDGSRIVFSHFGGAEAPGIWTVRPDGPGRPSSQAGRSTTRSGRRTCRASRMTASLPDLVRRLHDEGGRTDRVKP